MAINIADVYNFIKSEEKRTLKPVKREVIRDHFNLNNVRRVTEIMSELRSQHYKFSSDTNGYSVMKIDNRHIEKNFKTLANTLIKIDGKSAIDKMRKIIGTLEQSFKQSYEPNEANHKQLSIFDLEVNQA